MLPVHTEVKPNPLQDANLCSRLFFWWLNPLFKAGHKRRLEEDDMFSVLPEDRSKHLGEELQGYWDKEVLRAKKDARKPSLTKAIVKCYWKSYLILGIFTLIEETTRVVQPIFLGKIIDYFEKYDSDDSAALHTAYGYAAVLSLCTLILAILHHLYFYHVQCAGMRIRVAMCHMIYRKALRLSNSAMGKTTTGQIVNLLSNDVNKFDQVTIFLHFLWAGPLQAIGVTILLWVEIGISCLAGLAILVILLPLQSCIGKLFSSLRSKTAAFTDARIRTMNEVITGMRIIKMYAWEKSFADLITNLRKKEISKILGSSYLRGMNMASFFIANKVILFVTFTTYVLLGNKITASHVFVAMTLYGAVRLTVTLFFPSAIERVSEAVVSVRRIKNFLLLDELPERKAQEPSDGKAIVHVQDFTAFWDKALDTPTLQGLSFTARPGELLAVVGPVGAGKSSLLSAVLGELPPTSGLVSVHGRIAYVSQQPWVFSGTVRSNILFGRKYEKERYEKVIKACALKKDLQLLEDGDLTVIGDRGATLSGGQKARVNLARAVYQDADIYLLDDPLSAVDAEVGKHLFQLCICQTLHEKITILVTHQLQYLKAASHILILKDGEMVQKGTYTEFLKSGVDFGSLLKKENEEAEPSPVPGTPTLRNRTFSEASIWSQQSSRPSLKDGVPDAQDAENTQAAQPEESRSEGRIGFKAYKNYFSAGASWFFIIFLVLLNLMGQVFYVLQDWWLSHWANRQGALNDTKNANGNVTGTLDLSWYLGIYTGLTAVTVLFGIARSLLVFYVLVNASQTLHNRMFESILKAPVLFFDRNPIELTQLEVFRVVDGALDSHRHLSHPHPWPQNGSLQASVTSVTGSDVIRFPEVLLLALPGRILNRFSKDIGHMDDLLPLTFLDFIQTLLLVVSVIAVAAAVIPWILIPLVPLSIIFVVLRRYFLETSRDVKRLESTTRSPVFSHLSSSLQGLWTIRAYKAEERCQELFDAHQDLHSEAWFLFLTTSRWFAVRLDAICAVFVIVVAFGSLVLAKTLDAGQVGLALSYSLTLMGMFQWSVRQSAEVENMMISVERVIEYTDLEKEAPWECRKRPPPGWPHEGVIVFDNVNFTYSLDGPLVLKHLTALIKSREKVGIVGRTGAGKSSLISALFRLSEPEGKIWIDKILTTEIGLHDLRKKMSIIPQVQLKEAIEDLPGKMDTELAESGSNFSVGQRQLVCLARAILKKNRILIIDEATANVDPRTDELIQQKIREKFAQCTVLTIAHRLNTIIDSDKIMVLDSGRLREYDEPYVLLQNPESLFYKMVQQLGKGEAAALTETAKQVYFRRNYPDIAFSSPAVMSTSNGQPSALTIFETAL
ncbi:ATP-binding cassette subfamily C member 4 isoform X2 [Rattus norvegicus]|uniref:ATP-binding cassette subfamily C member 4 isoform X2 n=1 Tax=Rattus norvegicus TaxID=10116 RepID=UPI001916CC0C|nr:ATP-binding cassette subfamily C member 4 isoform X2 [Rattus norvegicus]